MAVRSLSESLNYDSVKEAIPCVYELVPETYRQRCLNLKKGQGQIHIEFAREKRILFDKWCVACKGGGFDSLQKLILLEDFKKVFS